MKKTFYALACASLLLTACSEAEAEVVESVEESVNTELMDELEEANKDSEAVVELNSELDLLINELNN